MCSRNRPSEKLVYALSFSEVVRLATSPDPDIRLFLSLDTYLVPPEQVTELY